MHLSHLVKCQCADVEICNHASVPDRRYMEKEGKARGENESVGGSEEETNKRVRLDHIVINNGIPVGCVEQQGYFLERKNMGNTAELRQGAQ